MPTMLTRTLLVCFLTLSSFAFAAESAVEAKPPVLAPTPVLAVSEPAVKSVPVATAQPVKIGYVDIVRIGSESERGKALKAQLNAKKDTLQGKIDGRKKQIEKLKASIEGKIATMTPAQREAKSKEFQKKLEDFQKFAQASEEEFYALQEKETKVLYEAIEQSAVAHGKAGGFAVIVIK